MKCTLRRTLTFCGALFGFLYLYSQVHQANFGKVFKHAAESAILFKTDETDITKRIIHIAQVIFGVKQCRSTVLALKSILNKWKARNETFEIEQLHLHIICDAKSKVIMNTVLQTWRLKNVNYSYYLIPSYKKKTAWMNSSHYAASVATLRLYLPEIFDDSITKVISLDTDVLFLDDISELWGFMLEANEQQAISMAKDESMFCIVKFYSAGKIATEGCFNGGVVLLHLDRLRQRGWRDLWQSALTALLRVSKVLPTAEQDIFSVLILEHKDIFYPLPCVWNLQLNDAADMSTCLHSRSEFGQLSDKRTTVKLLHMNRRNKQEFEDDEHLTLADVPEREVFIEDRLQWYRFERKQITLLDGYNFVDPTVELSHGAVEKIFRQINRKISLPKSELYCAVNKGVREFCNGQVSALRVPRMHAYFVDQSQNQTIQKKKGTTLAVRVNIYSLSRLEEISTFWSGPISVAVCASDREAARLPFLVKSSPVLSWRNNTFYHIVYTNEDACAAPFAHNAAVAFVQTNHVLILKDGGRSSAQKLLEAANKFIKHVRRRRRKYAISTAFIFGPPGLFNQMTGNITSAKGAVYIPPCHLNDRVCQFKILKRASAALLPVEISLVPPDASAGSFFDFLMWNLLNVFSDTYTIVTLPITSND